MSKKILILSGSPRKGGNSDILCDEFLRGAQGAGHKVKKVRVAEKKVAPCSGCYYCSTHGGACVHKDDMADILQKMIDADVIVLASPVYFYSISAQLKAVIDALWHGGRRLKTKSSTILPLWQTRKKPLQILRWPASGAMQTVWQVPWKKALL